MRASRRPTCALLGGAIAGTAALLVASEASAAGAGGGAPSSPTARWYVETSGAACESRRDALEHEIRLACAAVGGSCGVAATPVEAGLRAVLDCSGAEGAWSLVTRTSGGTVLSSLDLSGTDDDRLREAAVEVARDATPERSLAIETLRFSLSAEHAVPPPGRPSQTLGLAIGGTVSTGTDNNLPSMLGVHVLAGLEVMASTRLTLAGAAAAGGSGLDAARAFRGGAGVAFGAPFDPKAPVGFAVETGLSATSAYSAAAGHSDLVAVAPTTSVGLYGQGTFLVQWPTDGLRPFAALSASALSEPVHIAAGAEVGLAFPLF
jgi:hypothetical protein